MRIARHLYPMIPGPPEEAVPSRAACGLTLTSGSEPNLPVCLRIP